MSQYDPVTPARLQQFLARLGREVRESGRVYLVGGTGLMYQGLKGLTKDVDLDTPLPPDAHDRFWRAARRIGRELNMAIEEASPAQFIPCLVVRRIGTATWGDRAAWKCLPTIRSRPRWPRSRAVDRPTSPTYLRWCRRDSYGSTR